MASLVVHRFGASDIDISNNICYCLRPKGVADLVAHLIQYPEPLSNIPRSHNHIRKVSRKKPEGARNVMSEASRSWCNVLSLVSRLFCSVARGPSQSGVFRLLLANQQFPGSLVWPSTIHKSGSTTLCPAYPRPSCPSIMEALHTPKLPFSCLPPRFCPGPTLWSPLLLAPLASSYAHASCRIVQLTSSHSEVASTMYRHLYRTLVAMSLDLTGGPGTPALRVFLLPFPASIFCAEGLRSRLSRDLIRQFDAIAPPEVCLAMLHLSRPISKESAH